MVRWLFVGGLLPTLCLVLASCDDGSSDADVDADIEADASADSDAGDGDGVIHVEERPGCQPLVPDVCAFPYPSKVYLEDDDSTPTGYRVALTEEALPTGTVGGAEFVERFNRADGFSIATPWLTLFPNAAIDQATLPSVLDLAPSVTSDSSVQILDRETGERYPVWAELDLFGDEPVEQTLIIRPMKALAFGRTVVVVITDALRNEDGSSPSSPPPFRALRDEVPTDSETIEAMRDEYEALFTFMAQHDVQRERVLMAWEAVTFSQHFAMSELPPVVDTVLDVVEHTPPAYEIVRCYTDDAAENAAFGCESQEADDQPLSPRTWRRIYGRVDLPSVIADDGYIDFNAEGSPEVQGTMAAEFVVNVPVSLRDAAAGSAPVVVFGHGLLVDPQTYLADDIDENGHMELAERLGAIFIGTRWTGLSNTELIEVTNVISDSGQSFTFAHLLMQGIANQLSMPRFATTALTSEPMLDASDGSSSLIDTNHVFYTGVSQGGISGTTFMALSPHVSTGVLHVPSSGWANMIGHSVDFALLQTLLEASVRDPREQQLFLAFAQRLFDAVDPINYIGHIVADPLTALGPKNCLWQCAVGDSQAPWFGCDMLMRTGGFSQAGPQVWDPYGVDLIDTPTSPGTSAVQYYDPQLGLPPLANNAFEATGAHLAIRRNAEVHLQTLDYFDVDEPGRIVNHCDGPCVIDPVPIPEE